MALSRLRMLPRMLVPATVTLALFKLEYNDSIPRFTFCHILTWQYIRVAFELGKLSNLSKLLLMRASRGGMNFMDESTHWWTLTRLIAKLIYEWNWNSRPGGNII